MYMINLEHIMKVYANVNIRISNTSRTSYDVYNESRTSYNDYNESRTSYNDYNESRTHLEGLMRNLEGLIIIFVGLGIYFFAVP